MKKNSKVYRKVSILVIVICAVFTTNSCNREIQFSCGLSEASQFGINHLQPFVDAMEKYKDDNGRYPKNGLKLIPKYIDKLPVIALDGMKYDETTSKVIKTDQIYRDSGSFTEDGSYYSVSFYPKDDRICLLGGRNNICEYTSQTKEWGCYQH